MTDRRPFPRLLAALTLGAVLAAPLAAGGSSLAAIGRQLESRLPGVELVLEERLTLGRMKLGLGRMVVRAAGDEEAKSILRGVRRVEIADYEVRSLPDLSELGIVELVAGDGWSRLIHTREDQALLWVYARQQRGRLSGLVVIDLDDSWLSLVSIEGRIGEWLEEMASDDPEGIRGLF